MKSLALCILLVAFSVEANETAKKNCEAAVDAADSMNVNQKNCDYSDEGLNGFLQKAFKKGSEGAVLETTADNSVDAHQSGAKKITAATLSEVKKSHSLSVEVNQWADVSLARTQLLPKAMEQCAKGFSVEREYYRPLVMGRISLRIEFICFE
jgi:hypothetical protein